MSELQITWTFVIVTIAALLAISILMIVSFKNAEPDPEETVMKNAHEPLPMSLNEQEIAEYRAAIERKEQAIAEIFGLHYKYAVAMKINPSEIRIETDGRIFRV